MSTRATTRAQRGSILLLPAATLSYMVLVTSPTPPRPNCSQSYCGCENWVTTLPAYHAALRVPAAELDFGFNSEFLNFPL